MSNKVKKQRQYGLHASVNTLDIVRGSKDRVRREFDGDAAAAAEHAKRTQARAKRLELGLDPDMDLSDPAEFFALLEAVNPDAIERE